MDRRQFLKSGLLGLGGLLGLTGCQNTGPKLRQGSYFGSITGINHLGLKDLGNYNSGEKNGLVYTCDAGAIDMAHLREAADRTKCAVSSSLDALIKDKKEFSFRSVDPALYHVKINYPDNWKILEEGKKKEISKDMAITMGQYFAHQTLIWHEIITWYGHSSKGLFSEHISSFSWEDTYSDVLGTHLAAKALRESDFDNFDSTMDKLTEQKLIRLNIQSPDVGRKATRKITGKWYSVVGPLVEMKKRNFDVGHDNGYITPWQVPGICPDCPPKPCPVPSFDSLLKYGFSIGFKNEPKEWPRDKVFRLVDMSCKIKYLEPNKDFPVIIAGIKKEAIKKWGKMVGVPEL